MVHRKNDVCNEARAGVIIIQGATATCGSTTAGCRATKKALRCRCSCTNEFDTSVNPTSAPKFPSPYPSDTLDIFIKPANATTTYMHYLKLDGQTVGSTRECSGFQHSMYTRPSIAAHNSWESVHICFYNMYVYMY